MSSKKTVMALVASILLLFAGLIFLLDSLNVAFIGAADYWYIMLVAYAASISIAYAVVASAPIYFTFAMTLGGLFIMLLLPVTAPNVTHSMTWPLIPLFVGLGHIIANFMSKKRIGYLKISVFITLVSVALLVVALLGEWLYALPSILIITSVFALGITLIKHKKKIKTLEKQVIYVEPSGQEEKEDNEKQP